MTTPSRIVQLMPAGDGYTALVRYGAAGHQEAELVHVMAWALVEIGGETQIEAVVFEAGSPEPEHRLTGTLITVLGPDDDAQAELHDDQLWLAKNQTT